MSLTTIVYLALGITLVGFSGLTVWAVLSKRAEERESKQQDTQPQH